MLHSYVTNLLPFLEPTQVHQYTPNPGNYTVETYNWNVPVYSVYAHPKERVEKVSSHI